LGLSKDLVRSALSRVRAPGANADLVTDGSLQWVNACDGYAAVRLHTPELDRATMAILAMDADRAIRAAASGAGERVDGLAIEFVDNAGSVVHRAELPGSDAARRANADTQASHAKASPAPSRPPSNDAASSSRAPNPQDAAAAFPGVTHAIAVGAGKGGVGKSTIAVNLAVGLARRGHAVGLLDGDIYGPSLPTMLGLASMEQAVLEGKLVPFNVHGIKSVTIGKLVDPDKPLIWRGPMAHGAFKQLSERTAWGELDYLIIDLPPGTGDVALTMAQSMRLTGAVVVCTPQRVAQDDAVRAARMFQQLGVDVLGVVENMSYFIADDGKEYDIFGRGGAAMMAQRLGLPFLGAVPINMSLRKNSDSGDPTANFLADSAGGAALPGALEAMITNIENQVALASMRAGQTRPTLTIS
jgi:ATP-binding protein involved in chromosome partitioning